MGRPGAVVTRDALTSRVVLLFPYIVRDEEEKSMCSRESRRRGGVNAEKLWYHVMIVVGMQ